MATLMIAEDEAHDLDQLLDTHLKEMLGEIAKTDDRAYRDDLVARHDRLEKLRQRLADARRSDELWV